MLIEDVVVCYHISSVCNVLSIAFLVYCNQQHHIPLYEAGIFFYCTAYIIYILHYYINPIIISIVYEKYKHPHCL